MRAAMELLSDMLQAVNPSDRQVCEMRVSKLLYIGVRSFNCFLVTKRRQ